MQATGSAFCYQKQSVLPRPRANILYGPSAALVGGYGLTFNSPPPVIVFSGLLTVHGKIPNDITIFSLQVLAKHNFKIQRKRRSDLNMFILSSNSLL